MPLGTNIFEKVSCRHDAIKSPAACLKIEVAWFYSCFPFYLFEGARSQREIQIGRRAEDVLARVHLIMHYTINRQNNLYKRFQKNLETNSVSSGSQFRPFNLNSGSDTVQFWNSVPIPVPRLHMLENYYDSEVVWFNLFSFSCLKEQDTKKIRFARGQKMCLPVYILLCTTQKTDRTVSIKDFRKKFRN